MRTSAVRNKCFLFKTGTRIDVYYSQVLGRWDCTMEKESLGFKTIIGIGNTRKEAVINLRKAWATWITRKIRGDI